MQRGNSHAQDQLFRRCCCCVGLVGVGTWIGVGKGTSTSALVGSAVDPLAMMTSATDLRTPYYDDYSVVFVELQTKR
jgi:hypothetical protein